MQRLGFPLIRLIVFGGMTLRLSALASASNLPEQNILSPASLRAQCRDARDAGGVAGKVARSDRVSECE
jgi:hypothetical protein